MIKSFKTSHTINNLNVILGLLTQPTTASFKTEVRHYILGICDWCGHREIIDDPDPEHEFHMVYADALAKGLNWVRGDEHDYCTARCLHDQELAVARRYRP